MNHKNMVLGVDFGTTNSSAAVYEDGIVTLIDLDEDNENKKTLKSSIFISKNNEIFVGQSAINQYLEKFEGTEIRTDLRLTDEWADIIKNVEGDTIKERIIEEYEINLPGRFIISPKRVLPNRFFVNTEAFGNTYSAEDLVSIVLKEIKNKADNFLNANIEDINIGRPVHFSDIGDDLLAEQRIISGAKKAGFKNIQFIYEPIGAAYSYSINNNKEKIGLIFDFGGGTFDTAVVKFKNNSAVEVLSNEGVYIGGNKFNEDIIFSKFLQYFGRDIKWGPSKLEVPIWILENISRWEMANVMRKKNNIELLESIRRQTDKPYLIENLLKLIRYNLGLSLFLTAEDAKIQLSQTDAIDIRWNKYEMYIEESLEKNEFKAIVWKDVSIIVSCMRKALEKAGMDYKDISVVVKTGGSSKTFFIKELIQNIFPQAEIYENDAFTDVTAGLAIIR